MIDPCAGFLFAWPLSAMDDNRTYGSRSSPLVDYLVRSAENPALVATTATHSPLYQSATKDRDVMQGTQTTSIPQISIAHDRLDLAYRPMCDRTMYDICDLQGRVVKTGKITSDHTSVDLTDIRSARYVLLIVDGDQLSKVMITISR